VCDRDHELIDRWFVGRVLSVDTRHQCYRPSEPLRLIHHDQPEWRGQSRHVIVTCWFHWFWT